MLSTNFLTGSPCWIDLGSPDVDAAAVFYGAVFGWDFESTGPESGGFGFCKQDGRTVAAIGPLTEKGASSAWTVYFRTPDADATAKAVEQGGGSVRMAPSDVPEAGRMAAFTDPGGAEFAVWQAAAVKGFELASVDNALCWTELHVTDATAAYAFYRGLFGWRGEDMEVPGMVYKILATAEGEPETAAFGGIAPLQEGDAPRWIPYFAVASADETVAKAQQHGGAVVMPASDVPDVGRISWLADPAGAVFAVLKPAPPA
ncbi:VOC family protein [Streptomyces sp. NPDC052396]|uniref:VOC family protein n=1 Tax=Streptomyces sp. NPDC052396 TaxID=3365689 RepID=UPI0037D681A5